MPTTPNSTPLPPLTPANYPHHPGEVEYRRCPVTNRLVLVLKAR
jgi:hypothetical protein